MPPEEQLLDLLDLWQLAVADRRAPSAADLCAECPDLVAPLQERIAVLERFEQLRTSIARTTATEARHSGTIDHKADDPFETMYHEARFAATACPTIAPPAVGDSFAGFKLLGVLGEGGFGTVFRAEDIELRRKVALKILHARALSRPGAQESFLAEARALASVQHDHVVPIFQVGRVFQGGREGCQLFLAMPLLGGESLAARIERQGALPADEVLRIGREIAAGLAAIHAKGLVHRDLKPGNVWLEAGSGRVKVLDLGLAHDPLATGDVIAGTPSYMSPEQADGKELDFRSDLFSLGTVLYECASGRQPFGSALMSDTLRAVREHQPTPLARVNPAVPVEIATLVERLHQKNPANRPSSAAEVEQLLCDAERGSHTVFPPDAGRNGGTRRPRVGCTVTVTFLLLVGACLAVTMHLLHRERDISSPRTGPGAYSVSVERSELHVLSLSVAHYSAANRNDVELRGVIGKQSFGATLGDEFVVGAFISRPAYSYLIVFRPDGKDAVLYPQDDNQPPVKTEVIYSSRRRDERYVMQEGTGLWLVAVVVSDQPLPSYRDWRASHAGSPWKTTAGQPDRVWYDDGKYLEMLDRGRLRGDRASNSAADKAPIVRVVDWLRAESKGTVAAVGFTVQAKP